MSKIKLDERIENAMNAFFESPPDQSRFALTYIGEATITASESTFSEKADKWSGILRELLMFGPGVLFLFCGTLTSAFFYGSEGLAFGYKWFLTYLPLIFLTYAGSGSIKNFKNLAVPGTVIVLSLAIVFLPPLFFGKELAEQYFWHSMYLFPLVMIAAKLVQSWASDK